MTRTARASSTGRRRSPLAAGCALGALVAALAMPGAARAQAVQASPFISSGTGSINQTATVDTITITSPEAIVDWEPFDGAIGGGEIDFLPGGNTLNFAGGAEYTVLNRVIPVDPSRPIRFDGTVQSTVGGLPGGTIWFYSPGGIVIGGTAVFDVGSLLLTANYVDDSGGLYGGSNQIRTAADPDSRASVTVEQGAQLNALLDGSYIALVAPRIDMGGTITVNGPAALIAAEAVDLTINNGAFDIAVSTGSYVDGGTPGDDQTFSHTGTTTGPSSTGPGDFHGIYMVAVSKNEAITMLVSGSIGYEPAAMVGVENGVIYLSATTGFVPTMDLNRAPGSGIAEPASAQGSIRIENATASSRIQAVASDTITLAANMASSSFDEDVALYAGNAVSIYAYGDSSALVFDGDLIAAANNFEYGGYVEITANSTTTIDIQGDLLVDVSDTGQYSDAIEQGGDVVVTADEGEITITGDMLIDASATGSGNDLNGASDAFGGNVSVVSTGYGSIVVTGDAEISAFGLGADYYSTAGGDGTGGGITVSANSGGTIEIDGPNGLSLDSSGEGGFGTGGNGTGMGGLIDILAESGGSIDVAYAIEAVATSTGGSDPLGVDVDGGYADGSGAVVTLAAADATIRAGRIALDASSQGGDGTSGMAGGDAIGGAVIVNVATTDAVGLPPGEIATDNLDIDASATGGTVNAFLSDAFGGTGGNATGGFVQVFLTGASSRLGLLGVDPQLGESLSIDAGATGGAGGESTLDSNPPGSGGTADGGSVFLGIFEGTIEFRTIAASANATGGAGSAYLGGSGVPTQGGAGGTANGGTVDANIDSGLITADLVSLSALAFGGDGGLSNDGDGGDGGDAFGGETSLTIGAQAPAMTISSIGLSSDGIGGQGGLSQTGNGGAGGDGYGGAARFYFRADTDLGGDSTILTAAGLGGNGGDGPSGGDGGDAFGGNSSLAGDDNGGTLTTVSLFLNANAVAGAAQSPAGTSGDASGGSADLQTDGNGFAAVELTLSATATSDTGNAAGGSALIRASSGSVSSAFTGMNADGVSGAGDASGGSVEITVDEYLAGTPGSADLGDGALSASGYSGYGGQSYAGTVEIFTYASDGSASLAFASLQVEALGQNAPTDPAITFIADTGEITVTGDATFESAGDVVIATYGSGELSTGTLSGSTNGGIYIEQNAPGSGDIALSADSNIALFAGTGVFVGGAIQVRSASGSDGVTLIGEQFVHILLPLGSIEVLNGSGGLGGTISINAPEIIAATTDAFAAIAAASDLDEINGILGANPGPENPDGYIRADAIEFIATDDLFVQNSGVDMGDPDERAGFTTGTGGLSIVTSDTSPTRIAINGRITDIGGTVLTGYSVIPATGIQGLGGNSPMFDPLSTINNCLILGGNCITVSPPADDPVFDIPVQDLIEEEIEDEGGKTPTGPVAPLIDIVELDAYRDAPIIDDPVTGTGNDDLWLPPTDSD